MVTPHLVIMILEGQAMTTVTTRDILEKEGATGVQGGAQEVAQEGVPEGVPEGTVQ